MGTCRCGALTLVVAYLSMGCDADRSNDSPVMDAFESPTDGASD